MDDTRQQVETPTGTVIAGRYQVERLIARGGMAAVYLARQLRLNRQVAIKILSPPTGEEDAEIFEERFRLEAETLAGLSHANIVVLHDYGELDDGQVFLAMEYIDGPRLTDVLKDGPLPWERTLNLVGQVVRALRYAHRQGVVHRDLKPSNLLIRTDDDGAERVKVVDFGLVKLTEGDQSITRAGLILGSPHCMSPEQVKGKDIDHRTDIYAIGVLLFRCLTGTYPFHGNTSTATMIEHLHAETPTFFSVKPDLEVPDGLEETVRRCLRKNPDERFADASELFEALRAAAGGGTSGFQTHSETAQTIERVALPSHTPANVPVSRVGDRVFVSWLGMVVGVVVMLGMAAVVLLMMLIWSVQQDPARTMPIQPDAHTRVVPAPVPIEPAPVVPIAVPEPMEPMEPVEPAPVEPVPVEPAPVSPPPRPVVRPKPPPPKPAPAKPTPTAPEPTPAPTEDQPPGYLGMPGDF